MKVRNKGAKYSSIVGIGEMIKELEAKSGIKYLPLNRGVNYVTHIDLSKIIPMIDFNSDKIQIYPPNSGIKELKESINQEYFYGKSSNENIFVVNGGMSALDLIFKTLDVKKIYMLQYYWGSYINMCKINDQQFGFYDSYTELRENAEHYKDSAVIICDPNNPVGNKYDDDILLDTIRILNENGTIVIFDCPYRKIFTDDDTIFEELLDFENVIICESFSKCLGLSGQRIGFVHSLDKEFNSQFNINVLFSTNGINAFSQILIHKILSTEEGKIAAKDFKTKTRDSIKKNIDYLRNRNLLVDELYTDSTPMGIFVVIKMSFDELLENHIGSVSMEKFTKNEKILQKDYSRICVSVDHNLFLKYFDKIM